MQPAYFDEVQQWYVVFSKRRTPRCRLIHWLLCPDLSHVYLIRETPEGKTMVIDPQQWGVATQFIDMPIDEALLKAAHVSTAMLGYTADYRRTFNFVPRGIYTCVTLVKAMLALKGLYVTPRGLYKALLKHPFCTPVKLYDKLHNQAGDS